MTAVHILATARAVGVRVRVDGDGLIVKAASADVDAANFFATGPTLRSLSAGWLMTSLAATSRHHGTGSTGNELAEHNPDELVAKVVAWQVSFWKSPAAE